MSTVPNDQIKPHLLRKVTHIILDKIRRRTREESLARERERARLFRYTITWKYKPEINPLLRNVDFLTNLLMSGKESTENVRLILSQHLDSSFKVYVNLCDDSFKCKLEPAYLKNLALRWTRFFDIESYAEPWCVSTLRIHNSIEKLSLVQSGMPTPVVEKPSSPLIAVVEACPNLSTLIYPPEVLVTVLAHVKHPFSKLHTIETTESDYDLTKIFTHLTEHPEQCPLLDTLTLSTSKFVLKSVSKSVRKYSIPTIKSFNIKMEADCCIAADFSTLTSICTAFPNLESASLTLNVDCEHRTPKLPAIYKSFEKFNPEVEFTFNYTMKHDYDYSDDDLDRIETRLGRMGTITSVVQEYKELTYSVTTSYPKKTMKLEVLVEVDSDDESCEDSEVEDDSEEDY
uniref:F-box domain-containing protein n=1 Tax=Panagrellus redivivus TaxID=6233 RepID=A0A7E4VLM2_PANRE